MNPKDLEILFDKLKKDFDQAVDNLDKGLEIIFNQPNPDVGVTPKNTVYKERRLKVYRYKKIRKKATRPPLLIINSLINGYYILDLLPDFSLVDYLVTNGVDIYTTHWGSPETGEKNISFDYHITGYLHNVIEEIKQDAGVDKVNILGYCMGGNLGMIYACLFPENVNAFISLAAPVDFSKGGVLATWANSGIVDIEEFIDSFGNLPTHIMDMVFPWIKPSERMKATGFLFKNPNNTFYSNLYKAIMQWRDDNSPLPGNFTKKYIKDLYQENKLYKGELKIDGKKVNLKNITCPVLNIIATNDYITPPESARPLLDLVKSSDKEILVINGGHLDIILNIMARKPAWDKILKWIKKHSE